ncbi:MAG: hypothetical protein AB1778_01740 [Candidatus Bipolaricaulota bacterium]
MRTPIPYRRPLHVKRMALFGCLIVAVLTGSCLGDQLQWNSLSVCEAAASSLTAPSLIVSFCSRADRDEVQLWQVSGAQIAATSAPGLFELIVSASVLYTSDSTYSAADFPVPDELWTFHPVQEEGAFTVGIDLAYVYVWIGGRSFRCLGRLLGLDCSVGVATLRLPPSVVEQSIAHLQALGQESH